MTVHQRIEMRPDVMLGKPVIRGTRVTVELVPRELAEGITIEDLLDGSRSQPAEGPPGACCCGFRLGFALRSEPRSCSSSRPFGDRLLRSFVTAEQQPL